ncbi:hypothetical protein ACIBG7_04970 [Nonomuraea sp. NPDC050328]|uniref:hypothetical protein n=1 Tax=Nonomuraea sp. NPDC050328 TaxID=3364361 RepID=UPI0037A28692
MGWLAKRRIKTGPTAIFPKKPEKSQLLALILLADPEARQDRDDILAADCRIHAPVEVEPELTGGEFDTPWACRVEAEGPLPLDFFDRYLAEGLALRLEGLTVCRGEVVDPADEDEKFLVLLPVRPQPEELEELLGEAEDRDYGVVEYKDAVLIPAADPSPAGRTLEPYSSEPCRIELEDREVALALAERFQGIAVDRWRFRID